LFVEIHAKADNFKLCFGWNLVRAIEIDRVVARASRLGVPRVLSPIVLNWHPMLLLYLNHFMGKNWKDFRVWMLSGMRLQVCGNTYPNDNDIQD
jgi:hypothetical protein